MLYPQIGYDQSGERADPDGGERRQTPWERAQAGTNLAQERGQQPETGPGHKIVVRDDQLSPRRPAGPNGAPHARHYRFEALPREEVEAVRASRYVVHCQGRDVHRRHDCYIGVTVETVSAITFTRKQYPWSEHERSQAASHAVTRHVSAWQRSASRLLPVPGVGHGRPGLRRRQRLALLQEFDADIVR